MSTKEAASLPVALEQLDSDLWMATRPFPIFGAGDVGMRMTVVRLSTGDLVLHSPVRCEPELRSGLEGLGPVKHLIGPNKFHHLFLGDWAAAYPEATLWGAPGLERKRKDLSFDRSLVDAAPASWHGELVPVPIEGIPPTSEVAFVHPASWTLILTDLVFNVPREGASLFARMAGVAGRFGPSRLLRLLMRDRQALRRSVDALLRQDFERVILAHGEVLESGGREAVRDAFSFLSG
jgi:hypothetical protein